MIGSQNNIRAIEQSIARLIEATNNNTERLNELTDLIRDAKKLLHELKARK